MLRSLSTPPPSQPFFSAPFNLFTHRRWMKPADTAQTRLETRTRDLRLDKLTRRRARLDLALHLFKLMASKRRGMSYVAVQTLSKWRNILGTTMKMGRFLHRYPHVFHVFTNPVKKKNLCCKMTTNFSDLMQEELRLVRDADEITVLKLKKLLMMSRYGVLHNHALWLVRKELGLPDDFRVSIIGKYSEDFRMIEPDEVGLVFRDEGLAVAEVEKWREREYREKWLSEAETKYAFEINFPTGFKIEKGFRERLKNWQRLSYLKPYEAVGSGIEGIVRQSVDRLEKRAVGIIHEFLSLTVEKMVELQRLAHFRKDFCIEVNLRELLLKHPGIFYISTKAKKHTVYLREAYRKGALVEPNPVYLVRMKMLELIYFGCRNTRQLQKNEYVEEDKHDEADSVHSDRDLPVLDSSNDENVSFHSQIKVSSDSNMNSVKE